MPPLSLSGRVVAATDLAPLRGIAVQLHGPATSLMSIPGAQANTSGRQICWTRRLKGFAGTRWDCWSRHLRGRITMTWEQFRDQVVAHNPSLAADHLFKADQDYLLPEEVAVTPWTWSRNLTGFSGSRWDCWTKEVQARVPGMTWEQFRDDVLLRNPQLNADGRLFRPYKAYLLPEPNPAPRAVLTTVSDTYGNYSFSLPQQPTTYELYVEVDGFSRYILPLVVNGAINQPIMLVPQSNGTSAAPSGVRSARTDYPELPAKIRLLIDQALNLLGDDSQVFDSLPPELRPLCYGASFLDNPNHARYKDFACADVVSIALAGSGFDIKWGGAANPHMADHYHPDRGNPKIVEILDPNDWQPGDVLVYGSNAPSSKARHVNVYVGPFTGTDRSGKLYGLSDGVDVVEGSLDFWSQGKQLGTGIIGCNLQRCLQAKRGAYTWVRHVRLREVANALKG